MGLHSPNSTQIPNEVIDYWMPKLYEVEFKVLMFICRKTFGWHKTRDRISLSQLEIGTGCSRDKICDAVKVLESHDLIKKHVEGKTGSQKTFYEVVVTYSNNSDQLPEATTPSSRKLPAASSQRLPTKETITKETLTKEKAAETKDIFEKSEVVPEVPIAAAAQKSSFFVLKGMKGQEIKVYESDVYCRLLDFPTSVVQQAIIYAKESKNPVLDPFKFIRAICERINNQEKSGIIFQKSDKIPKIYPMGSGKRTNWMEMKKKLESKNGKKSDTRAV
jgi:phage replication O-like protein O